MNLSLTEAFGKFGAKPSNRPGTRSAIAADGAVVLECSRGTFRHPATGVFRYEDRLSSEIGSKATDPLGRHLTLARDGSLPIRMVVAREAFGRNSGSVQSFDVRPDLLGKVVKFDGDHFIIDFTRIECGGQVVSGKRK